MIRNARTDHSSNTYRTADRLTVGDQDYVIYRLSRLQPAHRLPYSLKILLENLLRHEGGQHVTTEQVDAVLGWDPAAGSGRELSFFPARVLLQDFTGVPCVVDLVALREAVARGGGDPDAVEPGIPADLIIDHSVIAEFFGDGEAFGRNAALELSRNRERYELLRWAQTSFDALRVVPPDVGICHQVNLELLSRVVVPGEPRDGSRLPVAYPDTLVGTDSHTPMVNGLGVLGWGVGGIEAEAAMLGQPVGVPLPEVVGVRVTGSLPPGTTATDLVLTVAELLREVGVVGSFVEFYGPGVAEIPVADRATLGNMSPEYGSTCAIFPIDEQTLTYLRLTGRPPGLVALVEAYAKEQGLWHDASDEAEYSRTVDLDLGRIEPSIAGPSRPQQRIPLSTARSRVGAAMVERVSHRPAHPDQPWPSDPVEVAIDGETVTLDHGHVVVAAITSCTNTSNPAVMVAAGLVARSAVARGLRRRSWVKTTLAPGSRIVTDYLRSAGLSRPLDALGFNLVGYGCTTCIGNSGSLIAEVAAAVEEHGLQVCSVLSGNRNFEGRVHPQTPMSFLASPPLVVAYALAGTTNIDLLDDPLATDRDGRPVYLSELWPSPDEISDTVAAHVSPTMFRDGYADVYTGDLAWQGLPIPPSGDFAWDPASSYIRRPPFLDDLPQHRPPARSITGARVLVLLGDGVTTDHISPAGAIPTGSPAGRYLAEQGVRRRDFNSYGARRGNHEVMTRGTFANIRLRNQLVPGTEGGFTRLQLTEPPTTTTIFDAAVAYQEAGVPLLVIAGADYGSGSSRDWAAKGTLLLGVRAVIAVSYERIHRANLIGMGVLPLQLRPGTTAQTLGLTGHEVYAIDLVDPLAIGGSTMVHARSGRQTTDFEVIVRLDTPTELSYYADGGILPSVLRTLVGSSS